MVQDGGKAKCGAAPRGAKAASIWLSGKRFRA
jgi:hypothetical protein